eukprot:6204432-Pleurochrysis_carterae.AAC.1
MPASSFGEYSVCSHKPGEKDNCWRTPPRKVTAPMHSRPSRSFANTPWPIRVCPHYAVACILFHDLHTRVRKRVRVCMHA